jgi:isopentenyl diphosphate isomerase/L-lactate dehydrogenase-like FMN-dependent dehydrogenase
MRHVPAHPASPHAAGHNGAVPLVSDQSLDEQRHARRAIGEVADAVDAGGSDDERLLESNVDAWAHWQLHPHVLARPTLWALATSGASGVAALLHWFEVELQRGMALCRVGTVHLKDDGLVRRAPGRSLEPARP